LKGTGKSTKCTRKIVLQGRGKGFLTCDGIYKVPKLAEWAGWVLFTEVQ
jgi:hypothetical protein